MCAICQTSILDGDTVKKCEGCNADFHEECWNENGGCATYGCEYVPQTVKDAEEQETYWGAETKKCPMCSETIAALANQCPYCKEEFDGIEPASREDVRNRLLGRRKTSRSSGSGTAVLVFILGLLGCTAPFNLLFGGIWYKRNRGKLKEASPAHNLLAIIGLAISVVYTIFIILIIAFRG